MFSKLFEMIRSQCRGEDEDIWNEAVGLARIQGLVTQESLSKQRIALKVTLPGESLTRSVTLELLDGEEDWECSCRSPENICVHVVTAAIAFRLSVKDRKPLPSVSSRLAHVEYDFDKSGQMLAFTRFLVRDAERTVMTTTLAALASNPSRGVPVAAEASDMAVDSFVKLENRGCFSRDKTVRLVELIGRCPSGRTFFSGAPVKISSEARPTVAIYLTNHFRGFELKLGQSEGVRELFGNGVALFLGASSSKTSSTFGGDSKAPEETLDVIAPVANPILDARERELLTHGWTYPFSIRTELFTSIIPALENRGFLVVNHSRDGLKLDKSAKPRVDFRCSSSGNHALSVEPLIVYGDPVVAVVRQGELKPVKRGVLPVRDPGAEARLAQEVWTGVQLRVGVQTDFPTAATAVDASRRIRQWLDSVSARHSLGAKDGSRQLASLGQQSASALERFKLRATLAPSFHTVGNDFDLTFEGVSADKSETKHANASDVFTAFRTGASVVPLIEGGYGEIPRQWLSLHGDKLRALFEAKSRDDQGKLPGCLLPELAQICRQLEAPVPEAFTQLERCLANFDGFPDVPDDSPVKILLRDYQKDCVRWLLFLKNRGDVLGGGALLADDMGLGKTLETIAVLGKPSLVVAPTSVIHNWVSELHRFRPELTVSLFHGQNRVFDASADVVVTSYALMRNDLEKLTSQTWDTLVLDEAQAIKNPTSRTALSAFCLGKSGKFRIALTGTPVENRLDELWSELRFATPGLLGTRSEFDERFSKPISEGDDEIAAALRSRIRPFLLRRKKGDVATELPPKTEVVLKVELSQGEMDIYQAIRGLLENKVKAWTQDDGASGLGGASGRESALTMEVLAGLTRLRQACCHPALLPGNLGSISKSSDAPHGKNTTEASEKTPVEEVTSSKLNLLAAKLEELKSCGHRALVFSQWTSLLDLVQARLAQSGIDFSRLDGATVDRQGVVEAFQKPDGPTAMLVSLKAGGTGLNLTAADHVFLLDPWWNPAAEDQAASRAHRIGQERPVFVYRMVAMDTVEERILELQGIKRSVAEAALSESSQASTLTREDLLALISN